MKKIHLIFFTWLVASYCTIYGHVFCPICKKQSEVFLCTGVVSRNNASCPHCHSLERHRHLWLFLQEKKNELFERNLTLLHWAPESCLFKTLENMSNIRYIPADLNPNCSDVRKLDITQIELDSNSIDVILCSHVLEHVPDDNKAMAELFRVLRPGGYAIIMVPLYTSLDKTYEDFSIVHPEARELHFDQDDHVRKYGHDILERLKAAGFEVEKFPLHRLSNVMREQYGMAGFDGEERVNAARGADIFLCTKLL